MELQKRLTTLTQLKKCIQKKQTKICEALEKDFGKVEQEVILSEIYPSLEEIDYFIKNLKHLTLPQKVSTPMAMFSSKSYIEYIPKGKILVISPWNYPFYLAIAPIINAIAAGNTFDLAPSELTPNTSNVLKEIVDESLSDIGEVFLGGKVAVQSCLDNNYDHIFFTGSTKVGQIIMEAAAKKLTPVTLELGGKSPVIVDASAKLKNAAERVLWAKSMNSGQTCVAPDYIYVEKSIAENFYSELKKQAEIFKEHYPQAQIITNNHWQRLNDFYEADKNNGASFIYDGISKKENNLFGLKIMKDCNWNLKCMSEEIFGPILPCLEFDNFEKLIDDLNKKETPLSAYLFSENSTNQSLFSKKLRAGGTSINHLVLHLANHHLPFGGLGMSGTGAYHGKWGFEELSHKKAVFKAGPIDSVKLFYKMNNKERFHKLFKIVQNFT